MATRILNTRRRGFTLVELVVSMAMGAVLISGLASAVVIASRTLPDRNTTADAVLRAADVVEQMAGEMHCATTFTQRSATLVEIKIPDRNADLTQETVQYSWSGTPGDPLTRQYNGATPVSVVEDVQEFNLDYVTRSVTTSEMVTTTTDSGELLLAFFDGWPGITETQQNLGVNANKWTGQFFSAAGIPGNATKVTITRALLKMRQGALGSAGNFSVAIHRAQGGGNPEPSANPLGAVPVSSGSDLTGSYVWREFFFAGADLANANKEYVIVVKGTNAAQSDAEVLRYYNSNAPSNGLFGLDTSDAGAKWDPRKNLRDDYEFPFYVYGAYRTTSTVPTDVTRYFLTSAGITLRVGSETGTRVQTASQVLNAPEVTGP